MTFFNNFEFITKVEAEWGWIWRHHIHFGAKSEKLLFSHLLLKPIVEFWTDFHILVVTVNNNSIHVNKVRVGAIFWMPYVIFTVVG